MSSIKEKFKSKTLVDDEVSRFQQFLWWVAGADKSILIECRTDYQKYFAIGSTILMTTIIAFFAGGSAAWYFSKSGVNPDSGNVGASIIFGLLWASLIFSIDRSLVVTLKKDPTKLKQKFWVPLISRAFLACIIAFMVSIPLELYIFRDYISSKEIEIDNKSIVTLSDSLDVTKDINEQIKEIDALIANINTYRLDKRTTDKDIEVLGSSISTLKAQLNHPTSHTYRDAQNRINQINRSINPNKPDIDIDKLKKERKKEEIIVNEEVKKHNMSINKDIKGKEKDNKKKELYSSNLDKSINLKDSLREIYEGKRTILKAKRDSIKAKYQSELNKSNRFIKSYNVLSKAVYEKDKNGNLVDPTNLFFLWLIRIFFFLIEILPTIVKIATPIGVYDWRVYKEENDIALTLTSDDYIQSAKALALKKVNADNNVLEDQLLAEKELRNELISKISETQKEVTDAYLKDWKERELKNLELKNKIFI